MNSRLTRVLAPEGASPGTGYSHVAWGTYFALVGESE